MIAGQARVFGCLQENIAKSGFGEQCKQQVQDREARMQEDYRLDYGVASQCEADVNHYCSVEKVCTQGLVNPLRNISLLALAALSLFRVQDRCCGMLHTWGMLGITDEMCSLQGKAHGETQVIACLVSNYQSIVSDCQREVSRAVRMALWEYQPQLALTSKQPDLTLRLLHATQ